MGMTVKQVATRTGLATPTVRYYDRIGLVCAEERSPSGYRLYSPADAGRLDFIRRAKLLGLSLDEIRELMAVAEGGCNATMPELERLMDRKVAEIDAKIGELQALRARLVEYRAGKRASARNGCGHGAFCGCLNDVPEP